MQVINLKAEGDEAWPELAASEELVVDLDQSGTVHVCFLDNGTSGGQPVVILRSDLGIHPHILQLTASNFIGIAKAFAAKYPELGL